MHHLRKARPRCVGLLADCGFKSIAWVGASSLQFVLNRTPAPGLGAPARSLSSPLPDGGSALEAEVQCAFNSTWRPRPPGPWASSRASLLRRRRSPMRRRIGSRRRRWRGAGGAEARSRGPPPASVGRGRRAWRSTASSSRALARGRFAAFCINLGSFCCVLQRGGARSLENMLIL